MSTNMQYKLIIENRKYDSYDLVDIKTMTNVEKAKNTINPLTEKLFNHDIFTIDNDGCNLMIQL